MLVRGAAAQPQRSQVHLLFVVNESSSSSSGRQNEAAKREAERKRAAEEKRQRIEELPSSPEAELEEEEVSVIVEPPAAPILPAVEESVRPSPPPTTFTYALQQANKAEVLRSCLPGEWLVDDAVNFFVEALQRRLRRSGEKRFFLFNTFFWTLLCSQRRSKSEVERLTHWYDNSQLWEAAYWLLPIHQQQHWYLCVVGLPPCMTDGSKIHIYVLDSLLPQRLRLMCRIIRSFILQSWQQCHPAQRYPVGVNLLPRQLAVPRQTNGSDCGAFMLMYMQLFVQQPLTNHQPAWFPVSRISSLRRKLYEAIEQAAHEPAPKKV